MDPNETLRQLREWQNLSIGYPDDTIDRLKNGQELFRALDDYLSRGGFPPTAWNVWGDAVIHQIMNAE